MKRAELARLLGTALRGVDLTRSVLDALPARPPGGLPARLVAIGKVAPAMAAGALARWGRAVEHCLVVAPDETDIDVLLRAASRAHVAERVVVLRASHPLPDRRSVRAGTACLATVATPARRAILVLVSGGASALACAPSPGVTLQAKRAITRAMLDSGASVQDINVVRKHLSRLKGGGLARAAAPNAVLTLIASDVIGGTAADVGSGPTVPDGSSMADARRLLRRFAASFADVPLVETLAPSDARAMRLRARIIASPEDLARTVAKLLETQGLTVRVLRPSQGAVEELAAEYVARSTRGRTAATTPRAYVRVAEPSVVVSVRTGRGGRSTHLAALVGRGLGVGTGGRRIHFAAFATDGLDASSGAAGAIVDDRFAARVAARLGPDALAHALERFDTGALHRAMGTALPAHPTGHNLADLHVLVLG